MRPFRDLLARIFGGRQAAHRFEPDPAPNPGPGPGPGPGVGGGVDLGALVAAMNACRTARGLTALVRDARLDATASAWAASMASAGVLSHGDFEGRTTRAIPGVPASENIAEGYPTAPEVVEGWMNSPGHRANILGPYRLVGVGEVTDGRGRAWWCADFAGPPVG